MAGKTVLIGRPKADLYEYWKDFRNLPHFMANIRSVEVDGRRSTWKIAAPAGQTVTAEVELVEDRPNERLAWKSTPSSPIATEGSVTFRDAPVTLRDAPVPPRDALATLRDAPVPLRVGGG